MGSPVAKQYLDDSGNPVASPAKSYLDDEGNPVGSSPPPPPTSGSIAGAGEVPKPKEMQGKNTYGDYLKSISTPGSAIDLAKGAGKQAISTIISANPAMARGFGPGGDIVDTNATKGHEQAQRAGKVLEAGAELVAPGAVGRDVVKGGLAAAKRPFSLKAVQQSLEASKGSIQQGLEKHLTDIQGGWHKNFRGLLDDAAKEYGVKPAHADSLNDAAMNISKALKTKASGMYKQLDDAIGGTRFQTFDEQIKNVKRLFRDSAGVDPEKDGILIERINALEGARDKALAEAVSKGVDPNLIHEANTAYRRGSAFEDLGKHVQASTSGLRADISQGTRAAEESLSPAKLAPRANSMYNKGRLQQALGEDRAKDLLRHIEGTTQKAKDAASFAAKRADVAGAQAEREASAVKTRRMVAGAAAASVGAPKAWEWIKHFIGE